MAKFIGSDLQSDNWGEDYLIKKMMEYFDDSFVIYRNRPIFGAQFDVCLLAPKIGIIIFEVKAWKSDTIKEVKNGDFIVIKTKDAETGEEGESTENPTSQARGYVYKMRSKIRQKTGKTPLVYDMVAFPNLSKGDYDSKGIELRDDNLLMKPVTHMALAHVAYYAKQKGIEWGSVVEKLNKVNWSMDYSLWFNILVVPAKKKKVITGKESIKAAGLVISYMVMGENMSEDEEAEVREIIRNATNDEKDELPPIIN